MNTPYEELEYLAEYLPDEGEAILVSRHKGELVCELIDRLPRDSACASIGTLGAASIPAAAAPEPVCDPVFYGRLLQANERLLHAAALPVWTMLIGLFWACVAIHVLVGIGWSGWYWDAGLILAAVPACGTWIRRRRRELYRDEIRPVLCSEFHDRRLSHFALLGELRQHPEFRTLRTGMARWAE
ncbi:MAG: hypothetical protein WD066_15395 [Planctomycetaceae bacterium]